MAAWSGWNDWQRWWDPPWEGWQEWEPHMGGWQEGCRWSQSTQNRWWSNHEQTNSVEDDEGEEPIEAVQQKLQDCLKSLCKVDSFSSRACAPEPIEIRLKQETSKSGKHKAALILPPHFPVLRQTPWSEWHSSPGKAEYAAYRRALDELQSTGGPLDAELQATSEASQEEPQSTEPGGEASAADCGKDGAASADHEPARQSGSDSAAASEASGTLGLVDELPTNDDLCLFQCIQYDDMDEKDRTFGFLIKAKNTMWYKWSFPLANGSICLEPYEVRDAASIDIGMNEETLLDYHNNYCRDVDWDIAAAGFFIVVRLHSNADVKKLTKEMKVDGDTSGEPAQVFDWDLMRDSKPEFPAWLPQVLKHWRALEKVEQQMQLICPLRPLPSPASLEAALRGGLQDASEAMRSQFEYLMLMGQHVLDIIASTSSFFRHRVDSAGLRKLVQGSTAKRSSKLAQKIRAILTVVVDFPHDGELADERVSGVMYALFGAFFKADGGGFGSVSKLSDYLLGERLDSAPAAHLLFGQGDECSFEGRTPTYESFSQEEVDHEPVLRVRFEAHITSPVATMPPPLTLEYRRARPERGRRNAQERSFTTRDAHWVDIHFNPSLGTYESTILLDDKGQKQALANKTSAWLDGRPVTSLVNCKHNKKVTVRYLQLTEKLVTDQTNKAGSGEEALELLVRYAKYGVVTYSHCPDGNNLGFETYRGTKLPVIYSERDKTFISPNLSAVEHSPVPMPNKVIHWLQDSVRLAVLLQGQGPSIKKNRDSSPNVEDNEDYVDFHDGDSWEKCFLVRGGTGCTYVHEDSNGNIRYLVWDENKKAWMLPSPSLRTPGAAGTEVPPDVACWLKHRLHETLASPHPTVQHFMKYLLKRPWTQTPTHVKRCLPKEIELGLLQSSECLGYTFRNPLLLAEALSHASCAEAVTPCNDRLAFLGEHVIEALITILLAEHIWDSQDQSELEVEADQDEDQSEPKCDEDWVKINPQVVQSGAGFEAEGTQPLEPLLRFGCPIAMSWSPEDADGIENRGSRSTDRSLSKGALATQKELYAWRDACCNHLAYGRTAVRLSLHKRGLKPASDALNQGMEKFERLIQRLGDSGKAVQGVEIQNPWPYIIGHGAPRALGDAFLAVAGAIYLDSCWRLAKQFLTPILKAHVKFCEPLVGLLLKSETSSYELQHAHDLPPTIVSDFVSDDNQAMTVDHDALAPGLGEEGVDQVTRVLDLSDFHVRCIRGKDSAEVSIYPSGIPLGPPRAQGGPELPKGPYPGGNRLPPQGFPKGPRALGPKNQGYTLKRILSDP